MFWNFLQNYGNLKTERVSKSMQLNVGVIAINRDKKKKIKHIPKIKFLSSYISCLFVTSTYMLSNKSHRRTDRQLKCDEMINIFNQVDKSVECFW